MRLAVSGNGGLSTAIFLLRNNQQMVVLEADHWL
jgi:hypothetical protein